jgi:hypothetical protein
MVFMILALSCTEGNKKEAVDTAQESPEIAYQSFGDEISPNDVLSQEAMAERFESLKPGDTVAVTFTAKVNAVCQNKGCWMRLDMGEEEAMVKFKDYGFFMPKDIAGEEVIVAGKAFVEEMSVDEQRHYAEDAGKTPEEVAAITEPKRTLSFISHGVLLPEKQQEAVQNQ